MSTAEDTTDRGQAVVLRKSGADVGLFKIVFWVVLPAGSGKGSRTPIDGRRHFDRRQAWLWAVENGYQPLGASERKG